MSESSLPAPSTPTDARRRRSTEHWVFLIFAAVGLVAFIVLGAVVSPDERGFGTHEKLGLPPCGMMELAGVPCPGCGVTTSISLAANGRFLDSFVNQPFGFLFALASAAYILWAVFAHFRGHDIFDTVREIRLGKWSAWVLGFMLLSWVYKIMQA